MIGDNQAIFSQTNKVMDHSLVEMIPIEVVENIASYDFGIEISLKKTSKAYRHIAPYSLVPPKFAELFIQKYALATLKNLKELDYYKHTFQSLKRRVENLSFKLNMFEDWDLTVMGEYKRLKEIAKILKQIPKLQTLTIDGIDFPSNLKAFTEVGSLPSCAVGRFALMIGQDQDDEYYEDTQSDIYCDFWNLLSRNPMEKIDIYFDYLFYNPETHLDVLKKIFADDRFQSMTLLLPHSEYQISEFEQDLSSFLTDKFNGLFTKTKENVAVSKDFSWEKGKIKLIGTGNTVLDPDNENFLYSLSFSRNSVKKRKGELLESASKKEQKIS